MLLIMEYMLAKLLLKDGSIKEIDKDIFDMLQQDYLSYQLKIEKLEKENKELKMEVENKYLSRARQLFPVTSDSWRDIPYISYNQIVDIFGKTEIQVTGGDYQGEYWFLLSREDEYGFLCLSYGSCSGCDALEACDSYEDLDSLINSIEDSIQWKSFSDMKEYFKTKDFETDSSWYYDEYKGFVEQVRKYFGE